MNDVKASKNGEKALMQGLMDKNDGVRQKLLAKDRNKNKSNLQSRNQSMESEEDVL